MRALVVLGLLASTTFATAQITAPATHSPDGTTHVHIDGLDIPAIPNAPFTAKVAVSWDEELASGGTVAKKFYNLIARDSQGRVRLERRQTVPANSTAEPRLVEFFVNDPTSAMRLACTLATKKCEATDFHPHQGLTEPAVGPLPGGMRFLSRENLGEDTMQSLGVVGTRETITTAAGARGNDRVLISSKDIWYSPDLQINLSVVRNDPRLGQQKLTVIDLVRGEPDAKWFAISADYQIIDARRKSGVQASQATR